MLARAEVLDVYFAQGVHGRNSLSTVGMDPQRSWKVALRTVLQEHHGLVDMRSLFCSG